MVEAFFTKCGYDVGSAIYFAKMGCPSNILDGHIRGAKNFFSLMGALPNDSVWSTHSGSLVNNACDATIYDKAAPFSKVIRHALQLLLQVTIDI